MVKPPRTLTAFGKDIDALLEQAGKISIREYADQANVNYKYVNQLRTVSTRKPGKLYPNLLKPFVQLNIIDILDSHQLSLRHRNKPLSIVECQELFPDIPEQELVGSVKQVLESEDSHDTILETVVPSPLYHRVFVGRETELGVLQSVFNIAVSGQGSLVMVVGEPGIGKTALCQRISAYVSSRGGKTLVGHCYSEKSLSLPYLAFTEVLRSSVQAENISELRKELGSGTATLGRIIPEIAEKLKVDPRQKGDPEEDRYRLMEAVTQFLGNIATTQPMLIILEDLHNADKGTLEMLTHVSRYLEGKRLLLVGTYRDVEVDRTHPLSATLAELRRLPNFGRVLVRGLNADEVRQMISSITGQDVPRGFSESIHRQTEGNPLFVQEVIRYLVEEGFISPQGEIEQTLKDTSIEMRIPDGLRDVIGRRLLRLSESCNKVLATASVIGRDFRLEVLQRVCDINDEELFKALEEAIKAAVIEEKTGALATVNYRFAHAFFRQTLYEEIIAPRRIRLHQQVGQALEEVYRTRLEEHAAELTEHLSYSSNPADLTKAVRYGEMAAQQAINIYAYWEAVRLLEQAIQVQDALDPEDKEKQCDLLLALCEALLWAGQPRRALDVEAPAAFKLAEDIGDNERASMVCQLAIRALNYYGNINAYRTTEGAQWTERADRYARPGTVARAWADMSLGTVRYSTGHFRSGIRLYRNALDLARRLGDPELFWWAAAVNIFALSTPQHADEQLRLAEELMQTSRKGVRMMFAMLGLWMLGHAFLAAGQRERAESAWDEHREWAKRTGQVYFVRQAMEHEVKIATIDGRFEEASEIEGRRIALGEEMGLEVRGDWGALRHLLYLGKDIDAFYEALQLDVAGRPNYQQGILCLAYLGRKDEVATMLEQAVLARPGIGSAEDETPLQIDIALLQAAVLAEHRESAGLLLSRLAGSGVRTTGLFETTCTARHLGAAAVLLGRLEEARTHYQEATKVCTDMRFRPELALTRLQLAELLLEHYPDEKSEALEHLDFAISEFREMKMQPSLERALKHKEILGA